MGASSSNSSPLINSASANDQPHIPKPRKSKLSFVKQGLQHFSILRAYLFRGCFGALRRSLFRPRRFRPASNFTPGSWPRGIGEGALGGESMGNVLKVFRNCKVSKGSISQASHKEPESDKEDASFNNDGVTVASSSDICHRTEMEDAGKMLDSLSLSSDNDSKLERLQLRLDKKQLFVPLNEEEEEAVAIAFANRNRRKVLVIHETSNIEITGGLLQCLRPREWLNDEVINLYLELLKEREHREPKEFLKCHFFNTFFYKKLTGGENCYDHKFVRRWTTHKKLGYSLIDCDKIFVPIHKEVHWCLAVINVKDKTFQYLDSLGGKDSHVLKLLARYFVDEVKEKNGKDIDVNSWEFEYVNNLPAQKNSYDCGVFMIKYIDFYSRGMRLDFSQKDIPYFRMRTAHEILRLRAD